MIGIDAIYILNSSGNLLISKQYRHHVITGVPEIFKTNILAKKESQRKICFFEQNKYFLWSQPSPRLYFVAVSSANSNAVMVAVFLSRLASLLKSYLMDLTESAIHKDFVCVHELLDEAMDNGYPATTDANTLREYIKLDYNRMKIADIKQPISATSGVTWRPAGIKYKSNEIFLDVAEKISMLIDSKGSVLRSQVRGALKMKVHVSGMPKLKLGVNEKTDNLDNTGSVNKVELEGVLFHQCVNLSEWNTKRNITFIPPDGEFELMSYRVNNNIRPVIGVEVLIKNEGSYKTSYFVKATSQFRWRTVASNVEIMLPVPADISKTQFKLGIGIVHYDPRKNIFLWSIPHFPGNKEYIMTATFAVSKGDDSLQEVTANRHVNVNFELAYFAISGVTINFLTTTDSEALNTQSWVRYISQSDDYQIKIT